MQQLPLWYRSGAASGSGRLEKRLFPWRNGKPFRSERSVEVNARTADRDEVPNFAQGFRRSRDHRSAGQQWGKRPLIRGLSTTTGNIGECPAFGKYIVSEMRQVMGFIGVFDMDNGQAGSIIRVRSRSNRQNLRLYPGNRDRH